MKNGHTIVIKAVPTTKTYATTVARIIHGPRMANYGTPSLLLTGSVSYLVSKLFVVVYSAAGVNSIISTESYAQTNAHVERFNSAPVLESRSYVSEPHADREAYL